MYVPMPNRKWTGSDTEYKTNVPFGKPQPMVNCAHLATGGSGDTGFRFSAALSHYICDPRHQAGLYV
jgi:hypothetical protein